MTGKQTQRIQELLARLETIEAKRPRPEERAICDVARDAIIDELGRVYRESGLTLVRVGQTLHAVSLH